MLTTETNDFIEFHPCDGLYLAQTKKNSRGKTRVGLLCDLPDNPYNFAGIMMHTEDLANFLVKFRDAHRIKTGGFWPSAHDEAIGILHFFAEKSGNKGRANRPDRRIDLVL